jgi:hypothetical protein
VFAFTRTLVRDADDVAVSAELQRHYTLSPLSVWPKSARKGIVVENAINISPMLDLSGAGAGFFDELDHLVRAYPPTGPEAQAYARLAGLGLGTDAFRKHRPSDEVLNDALARALTRIKAIDLSKVVNGWHVNYHVRGFTSDAAERAALNRYGPGAHIAEEALYFSAVTDAAGRPLTGQYRYRLTFPEGQLPPVNGFWSLILYGPDFFLVDNPINRYAINDRTAGLKPSADGSLSLLIQHTPPEQPENWLPAPEGGFQLILRTYQPRPALLDGSYKPPPLQLL